MPSGPAADPFGCMMDGPVFSGECPSGKSDANEVPRVSDHRSGVLPDSHSPLPTDARENSTQGSVRSCPLHEVGCLPADSDRMLPREEFFLPDNTVRRPTCPLPEIMEALSDVEVSELYSPKEFTRYLHRTIPPTMSFTVGR
jgi:hypothetical protein